MQYNICDLSHSLHIHFLNAKVMSCYFHYNETVTYTFTLKIIFIAKENRLKKTLIFYFGYSVFKTVKIPKLLLYSS